MNFDLAVVGAGILGLAHALAAARRGKRVVVIDRDAQANGASVRNFGFVTVTGQERGARVAARHARRATSGSRWRRRPASPSSTRASCCSARRPEARAVLDAFLRDRDGRRLRGARRGRDARARFPMLRPDSLRRRALEPARACGSNRATPSRGWRPGWRRRTASTFLRSTAVHAVAPPARRDLARPDRGRGRRGLPGRRLPDPVPRADRRARACTRASCRCCASRRPRRAGGCPPP